MSSHWGTPRPAPASPCTPPACCAPALPSAPVVAGVAGAREAADRAFCSVAGYEGPGSVLVSPVPHQMLPYMNVGTLSRTELQLLNQLHCRRKRRHRTIFTDEQLEALESLFQETKYPDVGTREQLARKVHLREEKVEVGARGSPHPGKPPPRAPLLLSHFPEVAGGPRKWNENAEAGARLRSWRRCSRARGVAGFRCHAEAALQPHGASGRPGPGGARSPELHFCFTLPCAHRSGLKTAGPNGGGRSGLRRRSRKTRRSGASRRPRRRRRRGTTKVKATWTRTADGRGPAAALA